MHLVSYPLCRKMGLSGCAIAGELSACAGCDERRVEIMARVCTVAEVDGACASVAARAREIPFRWLTEGCECRAQLMAAMSATSVEVSRVGLPESAILNLQAERMLQGIELNAILFILSVGEPPVTSRGGSGFIIGPDPAEGPGAYTRRMIPLLMAKQNRRERPNS
jgi:hypothetical protein